MKNRRCLGMPQPTMPQVKYVFIFHGTNMGRGSESLLQLKIIKAIEAISPSSTFQKDAIGSLTFDKAFMSIKFEIDPIISSKSINTDQVLSDGGDL